jgi:hypothetical protein
MDFRVTSATERVLLVLRARVAVREAEVEKAKAHVEKATAAMEGVKGG